jgi:hypothetical protein
MSTKQDSNCCTWGANERSFARIYLSMYYVVAQGAAGGFDVIAEPHQDQGKAGQN